SRVSQTAAVLLEAQRDLYHLMAELAASPEYAARFRAIDDSRVAWLEGNTDALGALVEMPGEFIVPGDSPAGAALALARTLVRRAERRVAELLHNALLDNPYLLAYLNRLSSLCFVLELFENQSAGSGTPTIAKK
ncbi:MAG TPA: ATP:cob(I)alamin adenosyltransferase, partial [Anaerolineales bacterium]|nr:ATP:cob(I)alamin adenosyltransferase [Anaerolineales bacterium]